MPYYSTVRHMIVHDTHRSRKARAASGSTRGWQTWNYYHLYIVLCICIHIYIYIYVYIAYYVCVYIYIYMESNIHMGIWLQFHQLFVQHNTLSFKRQLWISPLWQDIVYTRNNDLSDVAVGEIIVKSTYEAYNKPIASQM